MNEFVKTEINSSYFLSLINDWIHWIMTGYITGVMIKSVRSARAYYIKFNSKKKTQNQKNRDRKKI